MKKLAVSLLVAMAACASQALVLQWDLASGISDGYTYAALYTGTADGTYVQVDGLYPVANITGERNAISTDVSSYNSSTTFFVGLLNSATGTQPLQWSTAVSYSDLASQGHIGDEGNFIGMANFTPWTITAVTPEPTSVLLVGIGFAVVLLRRRAKIVA